MAMKIDKGSCTFVILCSHCGFWAAIRLSMAEAQTCSADHERTFHPEEESARKAAEDWRRRNRHAADS